MPRWTRRRALDAMWHEAVYVTSNGPVANDPETDEQERLASMLTDFSNRHGVPLDALVEVGEMVRLASNIGYHKARKPARAT